MGLFIGAAIPLGLQSLCMVSLRLLVRFNILIAFAFTWINNPFTLVPMYYIFYLIGSICLAKDAVKGMSDFEALFKPISESEGIGQAFGQFLALGGDILLRWFLGALIFAVPIALASYFISLRLLKLRQQRKSFGKEKAGNQIEKTHLNT